ncbi:hypothetical protein PanWU01x14_230610, partial [Parasponia andersonii]
MKKGIPVRDHVLNMINYFGETEVHGAMIDDRTQVSMILESLSPDFLQFKGNYVMNKLNYKITQLLNELQTFESILKDKSKDSSTTIAEVYVVEENPSTSNKNKKRKNNGAFGSKPNKIRRARQALKRTTPRTKSLREYVFTAELKGIGRETI